MGNATSSTDNDAIVYAETGKGPSSNSKESSIYNNPTARSLPAPNKMPNWTSGWDIFQEGVQRAPENHCLGYRLFKWTTNEKGAAARKALGPYVWLTYRDVAKQALALGSGLLKIGAAKAVTFPEELYAPAQHFRPLGIFMKNCVEWIVAEQAANAFALTLVPLYDTLGLEALVYILQQTRLSTVIASDDELDLLLECVARIRKQTGGVCDLTDVVVVVDKAKPNSNFSRLGETSKELDVKLRLYTEVVATGRRNPQAPAPSRLLDDLATICYTSGTTGNPKGVLLTNGNFVHEFISCRFGFFARPTMTVDHNDCHISYLPLAHILERIVVMFLLGQGGRVGFYSGDVLSLMDDIQELKPTVFVSVPRMYNRIHDKVMNGLRDKSSIAQSIFSYGLDSKSEKFKKEKSLESRLWDPLVFGKIKSALGGQVRLMLSGAAPLDTNVAEKIQIFFSAPLLEGYGMTESMGGTFLGVPEDTNKNHVGGVIASAEFKLESVPEMGYDSTSSPPSGELLLRGPIITPGYFRNAAETRELIDKDGWMHTGDIVTLCPKSGNALRIIDRRKNIFKLSQGEYVAPEKIENVYVQCSLVGQIFVVGLSSKATLVAVVVPDAEEAAKWGKRNGKSSDLEALVKDAEFGEAVEKELKSVEATLKGFEKLKKFHLTAKGFTVENGLLTPTLKLKRKVTMDLYRDVIEEMYTDLQ